MSNNTSPFRGKGLKACSFLPAATQMIYDMGLQHYLHGVTFECPSVALSEKQKVVRCVLEGKNYSSIEIDKIFSASKAQGKSLYYVDEKILQQIHWQKTFKILLCIIVLQGSWLKRIYWNSLKGIVENV